jgi:hypothetical protein
MEGLGKEHEAQELYTDVATWNFNDLDYALIRNKAIAKAK